MSEEDISAAFNSSFGGSLESGSSESDSFSRSDTVKTGRSSKGRSQPGIVVEEIQNGIKISETSSSDAISSSSSEAEDWQERPRSPDLPQEYWQIQRLVKYIRAGNPTATIISLSSLRDYDLNDKFVQMAIRDAGGLEVLLNILETDESQCKRASLSIIRIVATSSEIIRIIYNMRGLETLVDCLEDPCKEVKILSAETIANICKIKKARRAMRNNKNGIPRLVEMLNYEPSDGDDDASDLEVARTGGMALWALAKSSKNREAIRKAGAIPFLAKLMKTNQVDVIIPSVGILQECASEPSFRSAIYSAGLLQNFVDGLRSSNHELIQFCAKAICTCAQDATARKEVYELKGIDPLIEIIENSNFHQNKKIVSAKFITPGYSKGK